MPLCTYCGEQVKPGQSGVHREITGWEELRASGGANKIVDREETGRWAHRSCVATERLRASHEQNSFSL